MIIIIMIIIVNYLFKKVKVVDLYSASKGSVSGIVKGWHSLPAHPTFHPQAEWARPAFAFPAAAGTHLPTPEGWKAE